MALQEQDRTALRYSVYKRTNTLFLCSFSVADFFLKESDIVWSIFSSWQLTLAKYSILQEETVCPVCKMMCLVRMVVSNRYLFVVVSPYLYWIWSFEVHLYRYPDSGFWTPVHVVVLRLIGSPEFLILSGLIPAEKGEQMVPGVILLVLEAQAARHGLCGHRRHQLGHLLEAFSVSRVHIHVLTCVNQ